MEIVHAIGSDIPLELREAAERTFSEIQKHFLRKNWKTAGIDAGHFAEAIRRIVDFKLTGKYTPIGKTLPPFNEKALLAYRDATGDESLRILIPRQLWALYALRNKRSIGHLGPEPANELDAVILLYGAKWVLGELIRITTNLPVAEARSIVDRVIERQILSIWQEGEIIKVLDPKASAREQVLLVLTFIGDRSEDELRAIAEYSNKTNFRKVLKRLHSEKLINFDPAKCQVSPTGVNEAERLNDKYSLV